MEKEFTSFKEFFKTKNTYEIKNPNLARIPLHKFHKHYELFNVSKKTFMNYEQPLTELQ